jgi:hypothetical protein
MTFRSLPIFMSHFFRPIICLLALLSLCSSVRGAEPSAEEIIYAARLNPMGSEITLNAQLRAGSVKVPFVIAVKNGSVRYEFSEPDQFITLRLGDEDSTLDEKRGGSTVSVPVSRYDDSVRGGLITYEDLALKFLYWKKPRLLDEEMVRSRRAWKIEISAPRGSSQYGAVRVWIDKESAALLRIEGYDKNGILAKRFEVVSAQKIDGQWMLKQMRVERIDPDSRKTTGITYLEVLGAK